MKNTNETQTLSKVDTETSDIFFNFGALKYNSTQRYWADPSETEEEYRLRILTEDAQHFLEIVHRPYLPEQLVQDFLDRS